MSRTVSVILVLVAAFLLWNVAPKVVAIVMGMILFILIVNKWDDLIAPFSPSKGGMAV